MPTSSKSKSSTEPTPKEIGERINAHLKRLEADPTYNVRDPLYKTTKLYLAGAAWGGQRVYITYIGYQGSIKLTRQEAAKYLAWLDAGNKGRHYKVLKSFF